MYFLASEIHFDIYFGKRLKPNVFSISKIYFFKLSLIVYNTYVAYTVFKLCFGWIFLKSTKHKLRLSEKYAVSRFQPTALPKTIVS